MPLIASAVGVASCSQRAAYTTPQQRAWKPGPHGVLSPAREDRFATFGSSVACESTPNGTDALKQIAATSSSDTGDRDPT